MISSRFCLPNFNSIKVQLELGFDFQTVIDTRFQFHKGTIRTSRRSFLGMMLSNFNSIKVQLEWK